MNIQMWSGLNKIQYYLKFNNSIRLLKILTGCEHYTVNRDNHFEPRTQQKETHNRALMIS